MSPQLSHPRQPDGPSARAEQLRRGDVVNLVNSHGMTAVVCRHGSNQLLTPNPTQAEIIAGPERGEVSGVEFYHLRLTDGPHQGKLISCSPAVIRFVARGEAKPEPARPKRRRNWLRVLP